MQTGSTQNFAAEKGSSTFWRWPCPLTFPLWSLDTHTHAEIFAVVSNVHGCSCQGFWRCLSDWRDTLSLCWDYPYSHLFNDLISPLSVKFFHWASKQNEPPCTPQHVLLDAPIVTCLLNNNTYIDRNSSQSVSNPYHVLRQYSRHFSWIIPAFTALWLKDQLVSTSAPDHEWSQWDPRQSSSSPSR